MADQQLGAGIIGTAHAHAVGHLRTIRESSNYRLVAVAEPDPELLLRAKASGRWEGVTWVRPDALLADSSIQVVCVETDPLEALAWSLRSIEAGKRTKIDKPPGVDYGLLKRIFVEAERRHLFIQMGYVYRYNPAFRLVHRAIQEGWLGPVRSVLCQMNDMLDAAGRRRLDRYPGGQMFEICCHMIDALVWLMGEPKRVTPTLRHSDPVDDELEDDVIATFEFDSALAVVKSNTHNGERYFYVFGEQGSIQIDAPDRPKCRLTLSKPYGEFGAGVHDVSVGPSPRFLPDMNDLAGAIRERRPIRHFTPEHDLMVQRTLLRACGVEMKSHQYLARGD